MGIEAARTQARAPRRAQFHAEIIRCGLQDRVIGGLVELDERSWRAVFLYSGELELRQGDHAVAVAAPALIWQPWDRFSRIAVRAGSVGASLLLGEQGLANAVGRKPEAAELRMMARDRVLLPLAERPEALQDIGRAFDLVVREARSEAPGVETIVEAQVRVLLVLLWRHATGAREHMAAGASAAQILQRFRQLLEVHFRDRWSVADYAKGLGMSADRLHDICTRTLGRPPRQLIQERTIYEAQALLERSNRTVDQIAAFLGFKSAAQFNSFFKAKMNVPPGQFRRERSRRQAPEAGEAALSFADWP